MIIKLIDKNSIGGVYMSTKELKVLIVDDDENIAELIKVYLESSGYKTQICWDGKAAQDEFHLYNPDLVLLDIMLPIIDGVELLKWIRKLSQVPVIMLTAKGNTFDKVLALEIGADDYLVKPFEPKELLARIKAVLRRYPSESSDKEPLKFNSLVIDINSYVVTYNEETYKLPPKEFELLYFLAYNKNKVFTRDDLLSEVWGYDYPGDSRTVDVHVKRLREKFQNEENKEWKIETVWGVGYKFEVK